MNIFNEILDNAEKFWRGEVSEEEMIEANRIWEEDMEKYPQLKELL